MQLEETERNWKSDKVKECCQNIREDKKESTSRAIFCKEEESNLIADKEATMNSQWEHFESLLNGEKTGMEQTGSDEELVETKHEDEPDEEVDGTK